MSIQVIKAFRQKPIVIYPIYLTLTGDYATAAALAQVLYWHEVMNGKFYKIDADFERELHLTPKQFKRVKTVLKSLSFLKITLEQVPAKTFYDVDYGALSALIASMVDRNESPQSSQKGQTRLSQKGQTVLSQKGQTEPSQKGQTITENTTEIKTEITNNNVTHPTKYPKPAHEIALSLSLVGLTEKQNREASVKLAKLSPEQATIAIQMFNQTVASGKIKKSPMALFNQLVNLGLTNDLELPVGVEPMPSPTQTVKTPVINEKERERTRLEVIKAFVSSKKSELLKEFAENGFVTSRAFGTIIEPDLKAAGLFD